MSPSTGTISVRTYLRKVKRLYHGLSTGPSGERLAVWQAFGYHLRRGVYD